MRGNNIRSGVATVTVSLVLLSNPERTAAHGIKPMPDTRTASGIAVHPDSAAVADAVDRYHHALTTGDSAAALALLTDDAVILESGGVETLAEYRSHHLPSDIAFSRAVRSVRSPVSVTVRGDVAWASSTSVSEGEYRGRPVNSAGAELMVLVRTNEGWKIAAIHWSARSRR